MKLMDVFSYESLVHAVAGAMVKTQLYLITLCLWGSCMIDGFLNDDTCGVIALLSAFLTSTCCMTAVKTIRGKVNKLK